MKRKIVLLLTLTVLFGMLVGKTGYAIQIKDQGIKRLVYEQLGLSEREQLTSADCRSITRISNLLRAECMISSLEDLHLFPNLRELKINNRLRSLDGIEKCKNLRELELVYCYLPEDGYYLLAALPELEKLTIKSKYPFYLSFLSYLKNLKSLDISNSWRNGFDASVVNQLEQLEELYLVGSDIQGLDLSKLSKLKKLALAGTDLEQALSTLEHNGALEKIEAMYLEGQNYLYSYQTDYPITNEVISLVSKGESLEKLDLYLSKDYVDLSILGNCEKLNTLVLGGYETSVLYTLTGIEQLEHLMLKISENEDFSVCNNFRTLKSLTIAYVDDPVSLTSIKSLANLEELCIWGYPQANIDLSGLSNLKSLKTIYHDDAVFQNKELMLSSKVEFKEERRPVMQSYSYHNKKYGDFNRYYIFDD